MIISHILKQQRSRFLQSSAHALNKPLYFTNLQTFASKGRLDKESGYTLFSKEEVEEIFKPEVMKQIFQEKATKEKASKDEHVKSYRNTTLPNEKQKRASTTPEQAQMLKLKIEENKDKYDFKYIKRHFTKPSEDKVYLDSSQIDAHLKMPQNSKSAEELLNFFHNNQFSFSPKQALNVYRKITKVIPSGVLEGGNMAGSSNYVLRSREDPRYSDRRMQNLLRMIEENIDTFSPSEIVAIFYCTVKMRFPEDSLFSKVITSITETYPQLSPKDVALAIWSFARMNYPSKSIVNMLRSKVISIMDTCTEEEYLFDPKDQMLQEGQDDIVHEEADDMVGKTHDQDSQSQPHEASAPLTNDKEVEEAKEGIEPYLNSQTIIMYYWGLAKMGEKSWNKVFKQIEAFVCKFHVDFSLQAFAIILYTNNYLLKTPPSQQLLGAFKDMLLARDTPLEPHEIVHVKLVVRSIIKSKQPLTCHILDILIPRLLAVEVPKTVLRDPRKRKGLVSNYCQIFHSLISKKYFVDLQHYKTLLDRIKDYSEDYSTGINPRDMQELVWAVTNLKKLLTEEDIKVIEIKNKQSLNIEKEMRLLSKKTALMLGLMSKRSREIVVESFKRIDYYEADLVQAFKKYKLVK